MPLIFCAFFSSFCSAAPRRVREAQNRPAILLVPDGRKFLGDLPHSFVGDHARVEVDHHRVVGGVDFGP